MAPTARKLHHLPGRYAVCRFPASDPTPDWALHPGTTFTSVTRTREELSVICPTELLPAGVTAGVQWHCLRIEGTFDLDEPGVLASVVTPLADAGLSVFAVATHDTDYLLVTDLDEAVKALVGTGHAVS
jgi:hypothetical protein